MHCLVLYCDLDTTRGSLVQNFLISIGEALLLFAVLGIAVVVALEKLLIYRRSKYKKTTQSFLDVINQR